MPYTKDARNWTHNLSIAKYVLCYWVTDISFKKKGGGYVPVQLIQENFSYNSTPLESKGLLPLISIEVQLCILSI